MEEVYKDIKGYEGLYKISNLGNIKNNKELILKQSISLNGYCKINIYKDKKIKTIQVHQLVAESFLNHKICGHKLVINHIDFDKTNNNVNNLEIVTTRENTNKKHIKSTSNYVGVCWHNTMKKWRSRITINGKTIHIGYFENDFDASEAYYKKLNEEIY